MDASDAPSVGGEDVLDIFGGEDAGEPAVERLGRGVRDALLGRGVEAAEPRAQQLREG
jgi:hypothetical protein